MSIWKRAASKPEPTTMSLVAASLRTTIPKPTGDAMADHWNDAISCTQAYLNGRALAAETSEEKLFILNLRADLNCLHMEASDG